jgi:hypothetical protein
MVRILGLNAALHLLPGIRDCTMSLLSRHPPPRPARHSFNTVELFFFRKSETS